MSIVTEIETRNLREALYGRNDYHDIKSMAELADKNKDNKTAFRLLNFTLADLYRHMLEIDKYKLPTENIASLFGFTKHLFTMFYNVDDGCATKRYISQKYLCKLLEAQLDFCGGNLEGALKNYCYFLNYINIDGGDIQKNLDSYRLPFEVLYNIVKICLLCDDYDNAQSIIDKYKAFEERKKWRDKYISDNANAILNTNNMYMFRINDPSPLFNEHREYEIDSALQHGLSDYLFHIENCDNKTIVCTWSYRSLQIELERVDENTVKQILSDII